MKKKIINILKILFVMLVAGLLILGIIKLHMKLTPIEIKENWNFKMSIDHMTTPTHILYYYFYDDYVIQETYTSGVLPSGVSSSSTFKKYKFKKNIDISKIKEYVEKYARSTDDRIVFISAEDKDGTKYRIPFSAVNTSDENGLISSKVVDIYRIIDEIESDAYWVKERQVKNK